jgi:hypothetical protein
MSVMLALIVGWAVSIVPSYLWLILLFMPGLPVLAMIYLHVVAMPFRIYEKGVTRTKASFADGLRGTEDLIPFDRITAIELDPQGLLFMKDLVIRHQDENGQEVEYFPFRKNDALAALNNPLDIYHVLAEQVPDMFDAEVLRQLRDPALFNALIRKIEEETTLEKGFEISRGISGPTYHHSILAATFAMAGFCNFLAFEFSVLPMILLADMCLFFGGFLAVNAILDTKLSIMGRMAYEGQLKDGAIEFRVGRFEGLLFEVGESIDLASISRVRILLNAWYNELYLMCYLPSGERYILPPSLSKSIVDSIQGTQEGFSLINPAASESSSVIRLRKGRAIAYLLVFCSAIALTTEGVLSYLIS